MVLIRGMASRCFFLSCCYSDHFWVCACFCHHLSKTERRNASKQLGAATYNKMCLMLSDDFAKRRERESPNLDLCHEIYIVICAFGANYRKTQPQCYQYDIIQDEDEHKSERKHTHHFIWFGSVYDFYTVIRPFFIAFISAHFTALILFPTILTVL